MDDAALALQNAITELRNAAEAVPPDMRTEVEDAIRHTEGVLEAIRTKAQQTA
jgi:hypothetical protein